MENLDWIDQLADKPQPTTAQPQADNLDWLDQFTAKEEPKNPVTNLATANQLTTPEQEAQVFRDSRTTGLPIDVLRELPHEAQMRMFEETVARDKRLQEYYSRDMSTAAISANDFEPLSQLAKTVDSVKTTVRSVTEGYEQGREDIGQLGFDLFDFHVMGDTSRESIIAERKALAKGREEFDGIDYALNLAAKTGGTMMQGLNTAAYRAGQGMVVGAAGGAAVGSTFLGAGAIPGAITGGTAGAVAGARIGLADATFRMEAGHAIDEFKQLTDENGEKIDQQLATIMGLAYGATASGIEQLGISALAKVFPALGNIGKGSAKEAVKRAMLDKTFQTQIAAVATKYAQGVTVETIEEIAQEAAQIFAGWAATKISEAKDDTYFDAQMFTAENLARLGQVAKETAIGVGTLGVGGVTVATTNAAIQTSKAQVFDQQQAQINEALQATQTKQLSPEHAEAFLDILGLGEEVYIPADAAAELYQSGATFLDKVGVSQEMVSDSAVAGQDVAVKLSSLHANLDPTEFTAVREIMKASPGAMSLRDVQAVDVAKSVDHIRELYSKATENEATFKQELARTKEEITAAISLRPDIETQLVKSGSTVTEYVNTWAKTVEAFSRRMAYYGAELNDTLQKIKVRVANAPTAQVMSALNVDEVDLAEIAIKDIEQNVAASEKLVIDGHKKDATISANAVTGRWFLDLGFSAKEATAALRAFTKGKKLTANQQVILDSWREENKRIREEFESVPFQMFQSAWHGSPHTFDKFSTSAIGTGEGAQAYGYGLYFAEAKEVAEWYKEKLTPKVSAVVRIGGKDVNRFEKREVAASLKTEGVEHSIAWAVADRIMEAGAAKALQSAVKTRPQASQDLQKWYDEYIPAVELVKDVPVPSGKLYHVELAPAEDEYLLWDKPLSEQSEKVRAALEKSDAFGDVESWADYNGRIVKRGTEFNSVIGGKEFSDDPSGKRLYEDLANRNGQQEASEYLHSLGIRGIKYLDGTSRSGKNENYNYVIFSDQDVEITEMFQESKSPRGSVEIAPNSFIVNLFERANTTTLLHETAHIFLEEFRAVAEMADANETALKDFETIKKWLKFDGGQFTTEQHETFARGFETYLMEGKAPDVALERAFERFKKWLTQIYREVKALRSPINDEVRGVFDRLLSTEQEIENAAYINEIVTATDAELDALKVKPADREYMKRLIEAGKRRAEAKLQQARDSRMKDLRKAWREDAEEELKDDPVYQLRDRFRQKGGGLDIDDVAFVFGPDAVERLRNRVGLGAVKKDGALVAQIAAEYGFVSPDAMLTALLESPSKSEKLTQMVDEKLVAHDEQFKAEDYLIEAEEIAEHVEAVGRYLAAAAGVQNRVDSRVFEKIAKDRMADMPVSQSTRTDRFIAAIKTALKKERTAIATGDFRTAYEANQQARLNLEFAKQSRAIRKIVEDLEKLATRVNKSKPVSWQPGYRVNAIRLATRFGLVKKPNYTADDFSAAPELAKLLSGDADALDGSAGLDWSDWLLKSDFTTWYKTLTVDQLEELSNLMKYLRHAGKPDKDRVMTFANMTKEEVLEQLLESLGKMKERKIFAKDSLIKRLVDKAESLIEHMSIGLYIWQRADNYSNVGKSGKGVIGPHEKLIHLNLSRASTKELTLQREIARAIEPYRQQIMKTLTKNPKVVNRTIPTTPSMSHAHGTGWTMEEVFAIALNRGNSYNWNAVLTGHELSEAQANELMELLSREDWDAIQGIWDTISGYWAQLQEVHERMNGFRQKKVEAEPFVTPDGQQMNGGYYPIKFDALMDETTAARDELQMFKDTAGAALAPSVRAGAMKARTNTGGKPVKLSLSVLGEHIDFVIGYLSHAELVRDINKLVTDKEYAETFKAKMGIEAYRQLRPMLKGIARAQNKVLPAMASTFEKFRGATSVYILGSSLSAPLSQPLGIFNFIAQENSKIYMTGLLRTIANPEKARADMFEISPYMQDRWKMINKQISELVTEKSWKEFRLFGKSRNDIREMFLILIPFFDGLTTTPMWWGKYLDSLATNDPETAARMADESVAMMQSSARPMDQSQIIREKGAVTNIFTMFFSFANAYFNYQRSMMLGLKAGQVSIPQFMRSVVLTGILPPLLWNILMNGLWGTPPEDEEDWAEVGYDVLLYQLYGVPFVRDVASYTARRLQGKYTGNIWDTPYFQVLRLGENTINSLIQVSKDLDDDEKREKALWSIAELTAITLGKGIPIPRIYKRVEEGYRQFQEEDGTLFNIVHPDPEKK